MTTLTVDRLRRSPRDAVARRRSLHLSSVAFALKNELVGVPPCGFLLSFSPTHSRTFFLKSYSTSVFSPAHDLQRGEGGNPLGLALATADLPRHASARRPRETRQDARRSATNNAELQAAMSTCLATARQLRQRFTIWALRLRGRGLATADPPKHASMWRPRETRRDARRSEANNAESQAARSACLATARQLRKRFFGYNRI